MDPYLVEIAQAVEHMDDPAEIERAMDKLEFLHEALEPDEQDQVSALLAALARRLESVRRSR
jgi:hypothetical protein